MSESRVTAEEFMRILGEGFGPVAALPVNVVSLEHGVAVVRFTTGPDHLRPGGTIAGPVLFQLADLTMFGAVLSVVGHVHHVVTTDATIHFLRRPRPGVLLARGTLLKAGRRLAVGEVRIDQVEEGSGDAGAAEPVAHAVMTYSIPPA
jgi:uncharacterized protein (TIGR00369 family)